MTFERVAGMAGIGFVLAVVSANVALGAAGTPPGTGAGLDEVAAYYADHRTAIQVGSAIAPLAWVFLAVFGAGAFTRIWRVEYGRGEAWSVVGVIGVVVLIVLFGSVVANQIALTDGDRTTTGALWDLHNAYFGINCIGIGVALTGFSIGGLRTATLRSWHGYLGLAGAGMMLVAAMLAPVTATGGATALTAFGFGGFGVWLVWLVTFGVTMLRGAKTPAAQPVDTLA